MGKLEEAVTRAIITNNLKPIYYFKRLGKVGERLFGDILDAQSDCMRNWESAQTFIDEAKKKYGYNDWVNSEPIKIQTSHGEELTLTAEQAMQLYASFERQKRHYGSAEHITIGGVVFTDEVGKRNIFPPDVFFFGKVFKHGSFAGLARTGKQNCRPSL